MDTNETRKAAARDQMMCERNQLDTTTDEKLSAIVQQINTETIARNHADATITGRLNALEKLVAENSAKHQENLNTGFGLAIDRTARCQARIDDAVAGVVALNKDVQALKEAQSVAALALEVSNIRSVLTQLLEALAEEEDASDDDLAQAYAANVEQFAAAVREAQGEHTLEQVKAAYLAIVGGDADELTVAHIETADTVADNGETYRLINSTHGRSWEIPKTLVAEVLAGEDDQ